ncbi:MAG: preprotein translocase subunit SecG [Candidatus Eisenbacteria bacterium]|nr:preprotein translocase subunit SecG [Candidatus Eisenbacteria bacterium]
MYSFLLILHLAICFALVCVVLIQSGKGGGLAGGAFGGSAQTVFGGRGATDFITRATMVLGVAFFVTSLSLSLLSSGRGRSSRSLMQEQARRASGTAPAQMPGQRPAGVGSSPAPASLPGAAPPPVSGATKPSGH